MPKDVEDDGLRDHINPSGDKSQGNQDPNKLAEKFPALAIPNKANTEELELDLGLDVKPKEAAKPQKMEKEPVKLERRPADISKSRSRSRSKSPDARKKKHKKKRRGSSSRSKSSRSRSRSRSNDRKKDRRRNEDKGRGRNEEFEGDPRVGSIYDGVITNVLDYGCFVSLSQFKRKTEGLVHVSNIKRQRIPNVKDHVSKGQKVKVKVVNVKNGKVGLSMKEVDQDTGEDLGGSDEPRAKKVSSHLYLQCIYYSIGTFEKV